MAIDVSLPPKSQRTLIGHKAAHSRLTQTFKAGSMPPVWLLAGEKGIGKATLAYSLAREMLAGEGQDPLLIALQISQGSYPNFLALERVTTSEGKLPPEIAVEEVRKVSAFLRQSAPLPGWRALVIDGVEEMNRNAANALLKILEEPPQKTVFFLITHSLGQVLPTIRSRSCKVQLFPLADEELSPALSSHFPPAGLALAIAIAKGSIGRAMAFHQAGGATLFYQVTRALGEALTGNWRTAQALGNLFDKGNPSHEFMLDLIAYALYRLIMAAHLPSSEAPENLALRQLASLKPMSHWVDAYHRVSQFLYLASNRHLDRNHVVMALFFMIENPATGDEFVYG